MTSDPLRKTPDRTRAFRRFRAKLRALYHGESPQAVRFRLAVIGVDLALIAFFIAGMLLLMRVREPVPA